MRASRFLGPVVATFLVAATGLLALPAPPAGADPITSCSGRTGVIVVVDFNELGGGVTKGCDSASGHSAAQNLESAGYQLTYSHAPGMQGFVCTVQGKPSSGECTATDAYWSLWWSDGRSGTWTYSSLGVDSLDVPAGGYVAFAWHQGAGKATGPDVQPTPRTVATATPTPHPSATTAAPQHAHPHHAATSAPVTAATTASTAPSASASGSASTGAPTGTAHASRTPSPTASSSSALPTIDEVSAGPPPAVTDSGSSAGTWIAIVLGVLVIGAAAAVPLLRRRRG